MSDISESLTCPNCNLVVDKNAEFCPACGHKFEKTSSQKAEGTGTAPRCPSCNNLIPPNAKFCSVCGTIVGNDLRDTPPEKTEMIANSAYDGKVCKICNSIIELGDQITVCEGCKSVYHTNCFNTSDGCNTLNCLVDSTLCRFCSKPIKRGAVVCKHCGRNQTGDEIYFGPKVALPGASEALTWSIVSLFCCGIVLGWVAISKANAAKALYDANPEKYEGRGKADAAYIIGIISIVLSVIGFIIRLSAH
jgi:RNA polymerase subunit RPABC4/transcription elongation factor Spt4